jgi:hypothetical protein
VFTLGLVQESLGSALGQAIQSDFRAEVAHHNFELQEPACTHVFWLASYEILLSTVIRSGLSPFPRPQHRKCETMARVHDCGALLACLGRVQAQLVSLFVISRALA